MSKSPSVLCFPPHRKWGGKGYACGHPSPDSINSNLETMPSERHTRRCFSYPVPALFSSTTQGCRPSGHALAQIQLQSGTATACSDVIPHHLQNTLCPPGKYHSLFKFTIQDILSAFFVGSFLFLLLNKKPRCFICSHPVLINCYRVFL